MQMTFPYGEGFITEELPDSVEKFKATFTPTALKALPDLQEAVCNALDNPIDSKPIEEKVNANSRVVIAFDDPTVMNFSALRALAVKNILRRLYSKGVKKENITLICATAIHRRFSPEEIANIIGDDIVKEFGAQVFSHDAEDKENLTHLGKTAEGYDVELSRYVCDSDLSIYINASSLRGLTGGWKSFCVGLSTFKSLRHNHTPEGLSAKLHDNPLHKMLNDMGKIVEEKLGVEKIFKIDVVTKSTFEIAHVFAGNIWKTREKVLEILRGQPVPMPVETEKADVLVYGLPAFSPYAVYSKVNPLLTLFSTGLGYLGGEIERLGKMGCSVIMATPCPDEWNMTHHAAYPEVWELIKNEKDPYVLREKHEDALAKNEKYIEKYRHHYSFHPVHGLWASYPIRKLKYCGQVFVAGAKNPELIRSAGFTPTATIRGALDKALEAHGKNAKVLAIQHLPG